MRASRALLEAAAMMEKPFESRLADLVRRLGTEFDGEIVATVSALGRLLAAQNITFTDFGDAVEKLATGGLEEEAMRRVFEAGRAKGVEEARREHAVEQAVFGLRSDGSEDWLAIALHLHRQKHRLESKHHQFVDDIASRLSWDREPSDKQGKYLISLFRGIGGRMR
jgi:hypothetical protein